MIDEWKPYVYKLTLTKGDETYYYIGSRSSKREQVNPKELLNGGYNSSSAEIHTMLEEGYECKREILHTFDGTIEGAMACSQREGELLKSVGAQQSDQWLNKNNAGTTPYSHSQEFSEKISEALKGKKLPPRSEEHSKRISKAQKGKKFSEAHKRKIGDARKGKRHTAEARKKMSEAHKGKEFSEDHKKRLSEAKKRYWAEKRAQKSSKNSCSQ